MSDKKEQQLAFPGMEDEHKEEKLSFHPGLPQASTKYFDAALLPDAPEKQNTTAQSYILYVVFPSWEALQEGIATLSGGERKGLPQTAKLATMSSVGMMKKMGKTFIEFWKERLSAAAPEAEK